MEIKDREFKTPEELVDFVIRECGDMEYQWEEDKFLTIGEDKLFTDQSVSSFNPNYILYCNVLLDKNFNLTIEELTVSNLKLDDLEKGWLDKLDSLIILDVSDNFLTYIPELPKNLVALYCSDNQLIKLPELPKNLKELWCDNCNLLTIPELPKNLRVLNCIGNNLKELPKFPNSLRNLYFRDNDFDNETVKRINKFIDDF